MISVFDLWAAIDQFACDQGMSLEDLAIAAGIPPSTVLPENRWSRNGQVSWPSLETITLLVAAAGARLPTFGRLVDRMEATRRAVGAAETAAARQPID